MKNLKTTIALCLSLIILSCSKDDDNPEIVKEYFPTKITSTLPTSTSENVITTIDYDSKNRISKLSYINASQTYEFELSYNSNDLIESIIAMNSDFPAQQEIFSCYYDNNTLFQIIDDNGTSSIIYNFTFNDAENKYTLESTSAIPYFFKFDNNGNILQYFLGSGFFSFSYNNNKGIYNGVKDSLPMLFASLKFAGQESTLFYSNFFATKEITSWDVSTVLYNSTVTRDSNNNIIQSSLISSLTNETILSTSIEYQLR
jgi:hypothetical protein